MDQGKLQNKSLAILKIIESCDTAQEAIEILYNTMMLLIVNQCNNETDKIIEVINLLVKNLEKSKNNLLENAIH